jgi:hypothetical protein
MSSEQVTIDDKGQFETGIYLEPDAKVGLYYPVALLDPAYEPFIGNTAIGGAVGCFSVAEP